MFMGFRRPLHPRRPGALAIPVLIHLIQRERKRVVEFPSLMFLRKIPYQSVRRRRIRDWFLLAMRLAALAMIVMAFARPFFKRDSLAAAAQNGAREAVILRRHLVQHGVRRSLAAGTQPPRATRSTGWARATAPRSCSFRSGAEVAVRSSADRGRLDAGLATAATGPGATRFAPALKLAASLLGESALPRREIVLISDFQRRGWEQTPGRDDVKLPERTVLTPVNVGVGRHRRICRSRRSRSSARASRTTIASRSRRDWSITARRPCRASTCRSKSTASRSSPCRPAWRPAARAASRSRRSPWRRATCEAPSNCRTTG